MMRYLTIAPKNYIKTRENRKLENFDGKIRSTGLKMIIRDILMRRGGGGIFSLRQKSDRNFKIIWENNEFRNFGGKIQKKRSMNHSRQDEIRKRKTYRLRQKSGPDFIKDGKFNKIQFENFGGKI